MTTTGKAGTLAREAVAVLEELSESDPYIESQCMWCEAPEWRSMGMRRTAPTLPEEHDATCTWRRALELRRALMEAGLAVALSALETGEETT